MSAISKGGETALETLKGKKGLILSGGKGMGMGMGGKFGDLGKGGGKFGELGKGDPIGMKGADAVGMGAMGSLQAQNYEYDPFGSLKGGGKAERLLKGKGVTADSWANAELDDFLSDLKKPTEPSAGYGGDGGYGGGVHLKPAPGRGGGGRHDERERDRPFDPMENPYANAGMRSDMGGRGRDERGRGGRERDRYDSRGRGGRERDRSRGRRR